MTDDSGPMVLAGILALIVVFALGVGVGRWTGRGASPSAEGGTADARPVLASPVPLRCTNGDPPRVWTRVDAEQAVHRAQVALDTALGSAWVEKRMTQWTSFGQATLDLIRVCWEAR